MRTRPSGLSLLEAVVTLFLVGLVLVIASGMLTTLSSSSRSSRDGDLSLQAMSVLERLQSEVRGAVTIEEAIVSSCKFTKVNPNALNRLPLNLDIWTRHKPEHMLTISYLRQGDKLLRRVQGSSIPSEELNLLDQVNEFSARQPSPQVLEFGLTIQRNKVVKRYRTSVKRYLP